MIDAKVENSKEISFSQVLERGRYIYRLQML